mgnify:CR=1 FL=1
MELKEFMTNMRNMINDVRVKGFSYSTSLKLSSASVNVFKRSFFV